MKKEAASKLILAAALTGFALVAVSVGIIFGEIYLLSLFVVAFCVGFFQLVELYLRIQHNILGVHQNLAVVKEKLPVIPKQLEKMSQTIFWTARTSKEDVFQQFQEMAHTLDQIIDFNESLLKYVEAEGEKGERRCDSLKAIQADQHRISESVTTILGHLEDGRGGAAETPESAMKAARFQEEILEYQRDQIRALKDKLDVLQNEMLAERKER